MVVVWVPWAPLLEQLLKVGQVRGLLVVVFAWALYCRDSVVWLALAIGSTRVVVVFRTVALLLVVVVIVVAVAQVVIVLAAS